MHDIVKIIQYFSELSSKVKLSNQLNLMDINILCENQVMRALNMLFDWKLYNANSKLQNAEALDLIDDENCIAIQVTSNTRTSKIKETFTKAQETSFANYQLYMFYLCDTIPPQTKKATEKYNIKALCFNDLVQGFYGNSHKTKEFIRQCVEPTVHEKFREYLHYPNKWSYDDNFGGYYYDFDPNFKIKIGEHNEPNEKYAWLCEIKAISKYYSSASMQYHSIALFCNDSILFETISAGFYQEGLTIMMPDNLFFDYESDLYFDGYFIEDEKRDFEALLTYFFNNKNKTMTYQDFVNTPKVLTYSKPSSEFIPLIFFKNNDDFKKFKSFINECINHFDYEALKNKYHELDNKVCNERDHRNCCFHFWIYDLYYSKFCFLEK